MVPPCKYYLTNWKIAYTHKKIQIIKEYTNVKILYLTIKVSPMKKLSMLLSVFVLLSFTACDGPGLAGKTVKKTYFTGGGLQTEFIMDDKSGQNGLLKTYGYDSKLTSTVRIANGVKSGIETGYDSHGRILWRLNYVNGRQEGIQSAYYPNGDLMVTYTYRNGVKQGVAQTYRKDGSIAKKVMYKNDRLSN